MVQGWAHLVVHHRFSKSSNEEIRRRATSSKPRPRVLRATAPLTCCGSYIRCVCARAARAGCMYPVCLYTVLTQCGMWSLRGARGRVLSSARPYPSIWMGPSLTAGLRGPCRTAWATVHEKVRRPACPYAYRYLSGSKVVWVHFLSTLRSRTPRAGPSLINLHQKWTGTSPLSPLRPTSGPGPVRFTYGSLRFTSAHFCHTPRRPAHPSRPSTARLAHMPTAAPTAAPAAAGTPAAVRADPVQYAYRLYRSCLFWTWARLNDVG